MIFLRIGLFTWVGDLVAWDEGTSDKEALQAALISARTLADVPACMSSDFLNDTVSDLPPFRLHGATSQL